MGDLRTFVGELRRRRVFRVAALYVAGGFGLIEISDILRDSLALPAATIPVVTAGVIAGLPVALFLGWVYDFREGRVHRTAPTETRAARRSAWPAASLVIVGGLAVAGAAWALRASPVDAGADARNARAAGGAASSVPVPETEYASIAVMPFLNLTGDPENEYFGDGLAEELANVLSRVDGLRVAARTSSFAFKNASIDARTIADTLGVETLLEGSVRQAAGRVRVGAQLIRAADGLSLWSSSWDRELTAANVFAIQDEITAAIAAALERKFRPGNEASADRRTEDMVAYDLYLLGRYQWARRTPAALEGAIALFERALANDSTFALAWAGLADAWEARPFFDRNVTQAEAGPVARAAAARALALGPDLAEAHAARGVILSDYDRDYEEAIEHLTTAVELNPNYAQAWSWLCVAVTMRGNPDGALPACDRAVRLDPLSPVARIQRSLPLMAMGDYASALEALTASGALGPLAWALAAAVRLELPRTPARDAAIRDDLVRLGAAFGFEPADMEPVVVAALGGESTPAARRAVTRLEAGGQIGFLELVPMYLWIGAPDDALRVFRSAAARSDPWLPFAGLVTSFDALRDQPDFAATMDSLGLPNGGPQRSAAAPAAPRA